MKGHGPVYASPAQVAAGNRTIKIKRGGVGRQSGSGPSGRTATPRAMLTRSLAERAGVNKIATTRQEANFKRKRTPPKVIYGT